MLNVQKFLMRRESGNVTAIQMLDRLKEQTGVKYSVWNERLVVLNYDQIESKKSCAIAQECRSLVLELRTWDVVSRSFNRFFNLGESPCPAIDITMMTGYEKMDGSLIGIFNYQGTWMYRTRSVIMPEGIINAWDVTWGGHIESAMLDINMDSLNEHLTYICELTSPENRVVTKYDSVMPELTLLAVRVNISGMYLGFESTAFTAEQLGLRLPRVYKFETISDCLEAAKELRNLEEGFVLYNRQGEPVCKVKNPAYVAAHHLRGEGLNPKRIKDLIFMNEVDEYLAIFPEDAKMFEPYVKAYKYLMHVVGYAMMDYSDPLITQKDFALSIKDLPYKSLLFTMRQGSTLKEAWDRCTTNTKYQLVDGMLDTARMMK